MTGVEMITPNNVAKAARFILDLDQSMIEERYRLDMADVIVWLKDSLEHYLHPKPGLQTNAKGLSAIENLEVALQTLLRAVQSVWPCLTEEAQMQLQQFLRMTSPRPAMA